jgi:hypothetical protein
MDRSTESELRVQKWDWEALEIDPVWENLKGVVKTGLIRDRSYLRWRYANHPTHRYHLFGVHLGGKAIGWLVTARIKKDEAELPEVRVVDLLLPKEILIQALEEAALTIPARALVAWLPANFRPASVQTRATETLAIHHLGTPLLGAENAQNQPYFTLGEADEWWW